MKSLAASLALLAAMLLPESEALAQAPKSPCAQAAGAMPERPDGGAGGRSFAKRVESLSAEAREEAILAEIISGNIPDFLRRASPVALKGRLANGRSAVITVCALPDYLAIGSDEDHLLIPMGLPAAWAAATRLGFALPTSKMVDAIYQQASARLSPQPLRAGPMMSSTAYYSAHSQMTQAQKSARGARLGELTAGHKKDVVLANLIWARPGRVVIYGWHRQSGEPIQPLSAAHEARYADYSHGVRLISPIAYLDGKPRSLMELMSDPAVAGILNHDGVLRAL